MSGSEPGPAVFSLVAATDTHFTAMALYQAPDALAQSPGGGENRDVIEMLGALARRLRPQIDPSAWMIVHDGEVVGLCSITQAFIRPGVVEIGYGIAPQWRGLGFASRAVGEVLRLVQADDRVRTVAAETAVDNGASRRTLEKNGFSQTGLRNDREDGPVICWEIANR